MSVLAPHPPFTLELPVVIRACREGDLDALEWFGMFTAHRALIREAWERHVSGENVMLVAESNRFPIGQAWIDLTRYAEGSAGLLWAVRVFPLFQGLGVGARLLEAAEDELSDRGFRWAVIGVEKHNEGAYRLYQRQGYERWRELRETYAYTPPGSDVPVEVELDEWLLRKRVG